MVVQIPTEKSIGISKDFGSEFEIQSDANFEIVKINNVAYEELINLLFYKSIKENYLKITTCLNFGFPSFSCFLVIFHYFMSRA
jgi:hypothetical protein